jgi:Flp pilus assembly protein TadD
MAEEDVIVVQEGDEDDTSSQKETETTEKSDDSDKKKKKQIYIIVALLLVVLILLLLLLLVVATNKKEKKEPPKIQNTQIENITKKLTKKNVSKDTIKELVTKANILYAQGQKKEALKLLDKLSTYSQSLSNYNLGVLKLKEHNCSTAIGYFNKAIAEDDNRCVSAINSTYCALKLNDKSLFDYYSKLAEVYLSDETNSKYYPYYYSLVHYYLGEEFEALQALKKVENFPNKIKKLQSMIYNLYDDSYNVVNYSVDPFVLGISYARIEEYSLAREQLSKAVNIYPLKASLALSLVDLKLGLYKEAATNLKESIKQDKILYPIQVTLKNSLFDVIEAQNKFQKEFLTKKEDFYDLLFYYAPYKVFNAKQTIDYIRKGSAGIAIDNIEESHYYLSKSSTISKLNLNMSKGIKEALTYHIYKANYRFEKLVKAHKNHEILHYDLALTYAQLRNYRKAYVHFLRAYHLNPNNYLSGVFAVITGNLIGIDTKRLVANLNEDMDPDDKKNLFYISLLGYINNNMPVALDWLQNEHKNSELFLAFDLAVAFSLDRKDIFASKAHTLNLVAKEDLIANLLNFYAKNRDENIKKFSLKYQEFFNNSKLDLNAFFYGPVVAQDYYLEFAKISGLLYKVREQLLKKASSEKDDVLAMMQSLGFVNLFTGYYEEAFVIFNDLIDNKKADSSKTLFYGAVSSIKAGHHANAIALLELAKGKNSANYEARYGLGLLYQEVGNLKGASIQYEKIPDNFKTSFFDFELK